jgi:2-methylisocitrate lyase-like PEP mutase family enzyme
VPLVVNARTDVYLAGAAPPHERLGIALERGRAYLAAGADCVFVPGLRDLAALERLVAELGCVSVLATADGPPLSELERIGVARVSFGPGTLGVAMSALRDAAGALLGHGPLPAGLAFRP